MCTTEDALWKTILQNKPLYIMGIYHPPPGNDTTNAISTDDITDLLVDKISKYNNIVMLGDLKMHVDDLTNVDSHIFNDTMEAFGLKQHVTSPTHKYSHILVLVYSKVNSELNLHNCKVYEFIPDHVLVTINTILNKTPWEPTERVIRDTTKLTKETLEKFCTASDTDDNTSLELACDQFHEELCKMLDKVAPQKVQYADRPKKPWFSKYIHEQRKIVTNRD